MKRQLLLITCICANLIANAQLEVDSNGNVGINSNAISNHSLIIKGENDWALGVSPTSGCGISLSTRGSHYGTAYGMYLRNFLMEEIPTYGIYVLQMNDTNKPAIGIRSITNRQNSSSFNISVLGSMTNMTRSSNAAAIYGSCSSGATFDYPGLYAGYFAGDVRVTSNIYGALYTPTASTTTSLESTITPLSYMEEESCNNLLTLQPFLRIEHREANKIVPTEINITDDATCEEVEEILEKHADEKIDNTSPISYGIPTEQLEKTYPELVYKDEHGNTSINYVGMVPLLVQSINELNNRIKELEGMLGISKRQNKVSTRPETVSIESTDTDETFVLSISQNNPNPFSEATSIKVTLPDTVKEAKLFIYDMTGKPIRHRVLNERGDFRVSVTSEGLTSGMYLYSLIADGKVVDTRKMIME